MKLGSATVAAVAWLIVAVPSAQAVDFLGVDLCTGSTDTAVVLPAGSELELESVEIGSSGGLVMLLSSTSGNVMESVDALMTGITGSPGTGGEDERQWSNDHLTALAQRVAGKFAALAVSSNDPCRRPLSDAPARTAAAAHPVEPPAAIAPSAPSAASADAVVSALRPAPTAATAAEPAAAAPDYEVVGAVSHAAADATWVDVMGVIANRTGVSHRLATFDVSLYDGDGRLICVDTISVSVLKSGQERAFRDAIRCPGYDHDAVARVELQFAGGL